MGTEMRIGLLLVALLFSLPVVSPCLAQGETEVHVASHRAIYKVKLRNAKNGSPVQDINGKMVFEISDTCNGWATQQQMQMVFDFPEGDRSEVASSVVTWESKDGKAYRFNVKRMTDGQEDANFKGTVEATETGRVAHYVLPKEMEDKVISSDAVFPVAHTRLIIQKAKAGEKMLSRRVFDGSDEEGAADSSAFIGLATAQDMTFKDGASEAYKALFGNFTLWPVRIAFYKPSAQTGEPDYEMELSLRDTGVADSIMIDYGDFSVLGTLEKLEPIEQPSCPQAQP